MWATGFPCSQAWNIYRLSVYLERSTGIIQSNTKQKANVDLSFCNHFTWNFCDFFIRRLTLDERWYSMKHSDFFETQRDMLHFIHLTKVLLLHLGVLHLEAFWMLSIQTVFPYALIWLGLPFLDFWRKLCVTWVSFIPLTCLCLGYQFLSQENLNSRSLQVIAGPGCLVGI